MNHQDSAWQYLIDVVFNDKKDVPIEFVREFRGLAEIHNLNYYCDFLRDKILPDSLAQDPWEWKYLEELSGILPANVEVLILKGAAARDIDLYPIPSLRKSCDLDIFIYGLNKYKERKDFIKYLEQEKMIELTNEWEKYLSENKPVLAKVENNYVDLHFDLFTLFFGKASNLIFGLKERNKKLEKEIIKKSISYGSLKNIKKMSPEDFWFFNIFHFLKDYPVIQLISILDSFLILNKNKSSLEKLKKHAKDTSQTFLYNAGLLLLSQLDTSIDHKNPEANWFEKQIFKIERIKILNTYSMKNQLISGLTKWLITTNRNLTASFILGPIYFIKNKLILSSIEENIFTLTTISNLATKILYTFTKLKNFLKSLCLKAASTRDYKYLNKNHIIQIEKKLISVIFQDLQLTFNVPVEFYEKLETVWREFLTEDHLNENIEVEKINNEQSIYPNIETVYSNGFFYLKSLDNIYGKASLNSKGKILVSNFWDVRTFALFLFRAMTFERDDLLLVHAGAVKINDETLIFPGESSTGKSTFFNLLTKNGAFGINDDSVLLKKEGDTWFVYPTPFMSKFQKPITCEKQKLTRITELIKICSGHEIKPVEVDHALAILLNNSLGGIIIDDAGLIKSKMAQKVINLAGQIKFSAHIKYSLQDSEKLFELINKWLCKPKDSYRLGSNFIRLVELRGISMEPTFKDGDILLTEEVLPDKLRPRDIVGFKTVLNNYPVIHRIKYLIKHKDQTTIITKGDNCIYEDSPNVFKSNQKLLKITGKYRN